MPESLLGAGANVLLCVLAYAALRLMVFVVALIARIRWKVPAADLQVLLEACFPRRTPSPPLPLPRRRNSRQRSPADEEAA
jgi:hypothetical protein